MNKVFQGTLVFLTLLLLISTANGESDGKDSEDPELRFNIQMTAALNNNDAKAQYQVAEMYEHGTGTPQNLRMAHLWYTKSANQGYDPAVRRLADWEREKQEAKSLTRERAEEQKRRQAEAEAAAAAKAARAEELKRKQAEAEAAATKALRERAEEQRRRQAEAQAAAAAAAAKAARAEELKRRQSEAESAKMAGARAEEQRRRQAEAEAAAAAAAKAAKTAQATEIAPMAKEKLVDSGQSKDKSKGAAEKGPVEFKANPCNTPTAKFTSTCQ